MVRTMSFKVDSLDAMLITRYARSKNLTVSAFARKCIMDNIEKGYTLFSDEAIARLMKRGLLDDPPSEATGEVLK